jgi:hypothetical protein
MSKQAASAPMNPKPSRRALLVIGAACGPTAIFLLGWLLTSTQVTASADSPDENYRAEVVDPSFRFIDRNFCVRIMDDKGNSRMVFRSPDEPVTGVGQERLLWSEDGNRFLLVGKFWVREGSEIADGECLYLLCDVASGKVWCNSGQQVAPGFGREELEGFDLSNLEP